MLIEVIAPKMSLNSNFTPPEIDRIIEMAWEDRTPFEAIKEQYGISEAQVIAIMRSELKDSAFKRWRSRVSGRKTKHAKARSFKVSRFKCTRQKMISLNKYK